MRADRLLSILLLLHVHRRMTARELAERLEVSQRTVHRDMEALSAAGVPVYAQRGVGGGWVLPDDYRTQITGLTEAEISALFSAQHRRLLADLGMGDAGRGAALKLLAAIPASSRDAAERATERIHIDLPSWRRPAEPVPMLPALQQAVWSDRRIQVRYRRGDGETSERIIDPLGLVAKGRLWYLVAASGGDPRTYRVSRIESVMILDEPSQRPDGFDLAAWWAESTSRFVSSLPEYPVLLRVDPRVLHQLERPGGYVRVLESGPVQEDGRLLLRLLYETEDDACRAVLIFGGLAEVLEPVELRDRVMESAREVLRVYERS
jgi:predicted DNA-binding transcriptional regulator YafY